MIRLPVLFIKVILCILHHFEICKIALLKLQELMVTLLIFDLLKSLSKKLNPYRVVSAN